MRIGIIGGTAVADLGPTTGDVTRRVHTPHGTATVSLGRHAGRELVFVARHGSDHSLPPHRVEYLANIEALRREGCRCIIATNAVGSMRRGMQPGHLVLPDQFLDFTKSRPLTFHEGGARGVRHVDMTEPYCPALRTRAFGLLSGKPYAVHPAATYVCTEGPRFETPAEIAMFERLGGDVIGMTGVPEVVLAREAGICYMSICVVTNFAAGMSGTNLTEAEVTEMMVRYLPALREFILGIVESVEDDWECACGG